jgi:hypothetical protein
MGWKESPADFGVETAPGPVPPFPSTFAEYDALPPQPEQQAAKQEEKKGSRWK